MTGHGVELVVAEETEMAPTRPAPPLEEATTKATWTPSSPPSKKTANSKEAEVGAQTGATQETETGEKTQTGTQVQKEVDTDSVAPLGSETLPHQGHSPHDDMRAHQVEQ